MMLQGLPLGATGGLACRWAALETIQICRNSVPNMGYVFFKVKAPGYFSIAAISAASLGWVLGENFAT